VARDFRQAALRAQALAAVAATLDEPERGETYSAALAAAQEGLRPGPLFNSVTQALERLARTLPDALLAKVLELADGAELSASERERVLAAVLERRVHERPDSVLETARELDGPSRDPVLVEVA